VLLQSFAHKTWGNYCTSHLQLVTVRKAITHISPQNITVLYKNCYFMRDFENIKVASIIREFFLYLLIENQKTIAVNVVVKCEK
jgi:hypothetical protein